MATKLEILLVDDDKNFVDDFITLSQKVFNVKAVHSGEKALKTLETYEPDAIILDLRLGVGLDGLETLERIRQNFIEIPVIMVTDHANVESAVKAIKLGAQHYSSKYPNMNQLYAMISKELDHLRWKQLYRDTVSNNFGAIVGMSPRMKKVYGQIERIAAIDCSVLILGETGTGKDLVARELHNRSSRSGNPFVAINCAAVPPTLFESELFGHERGAFTGAHTRKKGKFELADKGTLFLDEVSSLSMDIQGKLLTALDKKSFSRLGSESTIHVDVRVIAATNDNLEEMVEQDTFRQDLYYRLNVVPLEIPALKERIDDIGLLLEHFNQKYAGEFGCKQVKIDKSALDKIKKYPWPGNVRELENFVQRLVALHPGKELHSSDIKLNTTTNTPGIYSNVINLPYQSAKLQVLNDFKTYYFNQILEQNNGNATQAAKQAGLPRTSFLNMLREMKK